MRPDLGRTLRSQRTITIQSKIEAAASLVRFDVCCLQESAMRDVVRTRSVPQIIVSTADHERLTDLATASLERLPDVANELLAEMDRARVVEEPAVPANVVRMGSTVTFNSDDGHTRTLKLVYPVDESLDEHRISVMTPVGAALIGLAEGQSISWTARDGKHHRLTVTKVT
jgi:regulator of nucleoside diphosphate kinase